MEKGELTAEQMYNNSTKLDHVTKNCIKLMRKFADQEVK